MHKRKSYEVPEVKVIIFSSEDILCASGHENVDDGDDVVVIG